MKRRNTNFQTKKKKLQKTKRKQKKQKTSQFLNNKIIHYNTITAKKLQQKNKQNSY